MPSEVILPRVDMDMATGKISKWLVGAGATVAKGQPLFEIETDKATMEIEAEANGTIRDLAEAGAADIPVGSVVAWIFAENEAVTTPAPAASREPETAHAVPALQVADAALPAMASADRVAPGLSNGSANPSGHLRATPLARRLARQDGVDLSTLRGSGPRGRIQAADVAAPRAILSPRGTTPVAEARQLPPLPAPEAIRAVPVTSPLPQPTGLKRLRDGTGRPLLLVHGFGAEANGWRPFLQGRSFGRPVYGLDLPGHGVAPLGAVASFDDLVEAVETALADLDGADIVAHSLGGAVMTAVAARGRVDIRSLLLVAPAGLGPEINGGFLQGFLTATSDAAMAPWMGELVADAAAVTPAFVRSTLKLRTGTDQVAAQRRLAAAVFPDGTQSFSIRTDLAALRIPVRIVFGTADRIIPARHATGLPPLVALHLLPGIGHMPQIEAPETLAAILGQITGL